MLNCLQLPGVTFNIVRYYDSLLETNLQGSKKMVCHGVFAMVIIDNLIVFIFLHNT